MTGTPDPLQPIRDRAGVFAKLGPPRTGDAAVNAAVASAGDVPVLLRIADEVLDLHRPMPIYGMADDGKKSLCDHPFGEDTSAHFEADDGYWYCRDKKTGDRCSSCADEDQADLWEEWPCPTMEAITTALASTQVQAETVEAAETTPTRQEAPDGR